MSLYLMEVPSHTANDFEPTTLILAKQDDKISCKCLSLTQKFAAYYIPKDEIKHSGYKSVQAIIEK